jgi:DNA-binding CsgD family transcriptional regulator
MTRANVNKSMKVKFNIDLENMLHLPFNIYWKNTDGYSLGCNDKVAELIGFNKRSEIIDLTLNDFCTPQCASLIEQTDKKVIDEKITHCVIEHANLVNNIKTSFLSIKAPLYISENIVAGLFGISFDLKLLNSAHTLPLLSQLGVSISSNQIINNATVHFYNHGIDGIKFSKREIECLRYLKQGRTAKEIARFLEIEPRTVESYINNIKLKLNCHKKTQLLDKINQSDFF